MRRDGADSSADRRVLMAAIAVQIATLPFLSHGYDLLVSYVAAKNVLDGKSPYLGGTLPNPSYPTRVQGIGETPLWPLYLSLSYVVSGGDLLLFNAMAKMPILLSNVLLYHLLARSGIRGAGFYLYNPTVLVITVFWGKPDVVATLLAVASLLLVNRPLISGLLMAVSVNVKPLSLGTIPAVLAYLGARKGTTFLVAFVSSSASIFALPFVLLGWDFSVPSSGLVNWFREAGGLNPLNVFELFYGWSYERGYNPFGEWVSLPWIAAVLAVTVHTAANRPADRREMVWAALLGSSAFLVGRSRVSEQNLILPVALLHLYSGRPPSSRLWAALLVYSALNYSIPQLLYPVWQSVTIDLHELTKQFEGVRILGRFVSSLAFYALYIVELRRARGWARNEG